MEKSGTRKPKVFRKILFVFLAVIVLLIVFFGFKYGSLIYVFVERHVLIKEKFGARNLNQGSNKVNIVVIVVDGGRPDAYVAAHAKNILQKLRRRSAYTLKAKTITPSWTLPAHISLGTGLDPEKHGVKNNTLRLDTPETREALSRMVTVFDFANKIAGLRCIGIGNDHPNTNSRVFRILGAIGNVEVNVVRGGVAEILAQAATYLNSPRNILLGIHLPEVDSAGHKYGWMSPEQFDAVRLTDDALGSFLDILDNSPKSGNTYLFLTSDHGGHGKMHGTTSDEDMTIPWFVSGPGVKKEYRLKGVLDNGKMRPVIIYDTAATILYILGIDTPKDWDGKPVIDAFSRNFVLLKPH